MQVCRLEDLWILAGQTRQQYPFILTGCLSDQHLYQQIFSIGYTLSSLTIPPACHHPVRLDLLLAELLRPAAKMCTIAGCTIYVPDVPGFSGGILGDPGSSPASAGGLLENLQEPWSLITFPGGPGMAQNIHFPNLPPEIQAFCTEHTPDHKTLQILSDYTKNIGADKFIAVTDGSGPGARGAALIRNKSQVFLWRLEEVVK